MIQSRVNQRFKRFEVIILVLWITATGLFLLTGNKFSVDADVTEIYLCGGKDQNGVLLPRIDVLDFSERQQALFVCGQVLTDGRPADIDILIYSVKEDELIYNLPVGVAIPNGSFAFELPADILLIPGDYRIEATFAHSILLTNTIEVIR